MPTPADLVLLTKTDLLPHLPHVSMQAIHDAIARVMPRPGRAFVAGGFVQRDQRAFGIGPDLPVHFEDQTRGIELGIGSVDDNMTAAQSAPEAQFYEVKSGDTLSKIAKQFYGDANKYNQIVEANRPMLKDADEIYPGQRLRIPAAATAGTHA